MLYYLLFSKISSVNDWYPGIQAQFCTVWETHSTRLEGNLAYVVQRFQVTANFTD